MSFLITVTFDLHGAETSVYPKIQADLKAIDFSKIVPGQKKIVKKLPNNTFLAEFDSNDFDRSQEACRYVGDQLKQIFKKYNVAGKYFVATGQKWAWKTGTVSSKRT